MRVEFMVFPPDGQSGSTRRIATASGSLMIGREGCDFEVEDPKVSRTHALIYEDADGNLNIRDLGSTNGTRVNGKRVREVALNRGDEIRVGRTVVVVFAHVKDADEAVPLPAQSFAGAPTVSESKEPNTGQIRIVSHGKPTAIVADGKMEAASKRPKSE